MNMVETWPHGIQLAIQTNADHTTSYQVLVNENVVWQRFIIANTHTHHHASIAAAQRQHAAHLLAIAERDIANECFTH